MCLLIPSEINCFLAGDHPTCGVYKTKKPNYYRVDALLSLYKNSFKEAKMIYSEYKKYIWKKEINKYNLPKQIKDILLKYDFSWSWIWGNMTEEEIFNKFYK